MNNKSRRNFIKKVGLGAAAISVGSNVLEGSAMSFSAKSYRNIIGANERIHIATIGVNSRGNSMGGTFARQKNTEVSCVCDVDERTIPKAIKRISDAGQTNTPRSEKDVRKVLEDKTIDAIYTATPDHWHAPLTIMGCQAGKHVYVEKPLSHNLKKEKWRLPQLENTIGLCRWVHRDVLPQRLQRGLSCYIMGL